MKTLTLICLLLLAMPCMAQNTITFAWDLSADDAILGTDGGYHLYASKTSGTYTGTVLTTVAPGVTTTTVNRPGLGKWYFVATAFIADGTESVYSNEVSLVIKPKAPTVKSVVQAALSAPIKAVTYLASLFQSKKNLRIVRS